MVSNGVCNLFPLREITPGIFMEEKNWGLVATLFLLISGKDVCQIVSN